MATYRLDGEDFETLTRKAMGNPSTGEWSAAQMMQLVNLGQLEVVKARPGSFPMLNGSEDITTIADQAEYELTETDIVAVRYLSSSAVPRLRKMSEEDRDRMGSTSSVDPYGWYEAGGDNDATWVIGLVGTPSADDKTVTVHFTLVPPVIVYDPDESSTTNTSSLPQAWDLPIVAASAGIGLALSGRLKDAEQQFKLAGLPEARARRSGGSRSERRWKLGGSLPNVVAR